MALAHCSGRDKAERPDEAISGPRERAALVPKQEGGRLKRKWPKENVMRTFSKAAVMLTLGLYCVAAAGASNKSARHREPRG